MTSLQGKTAVVAGATRGAGRAIAVSLGKEGAVVYCTGRSVRGSRSDLNRPETIEDTADMVTAQGGTGIAVQTDHTKPDEVKRLFKKVEDEQDGRLDILINDIWGGEQLTEWDVPFWEHSLSNGLLMQQRAVHTHLITSRIGTPLMVKNRGGLIIEVTDGKDYRYRGNMYYSLAKISPIHLASAMAEDLAPHHVTALAVTPGFLRSEEMLDYFGVAEDNWKDAVEQEPHFIESETPYFLGQGVAALAADPDVFKKSGKTLASWDLADEYGFSDIDGRSPHFGNYLKNLGLA
ncbi:SDR family oxidoreductase [Salibacterium aidingense]|uniref:SDR family oxidoreductase n=1 Tax=Salibacterium aidingense TaxID=384933 RepID=UPI00040CE5A0|nr:SDR family oxidoreductase [Salibacterium aidingense]